MIDSVLSTGLQGVQSGLNRAQQAAEDIASATATPGIDSASAAAAPEAAPAATAPDDVIVDIAEAAVDLKIAENQVQASAAVVRTADEVLGTLLDTKA